MFTKAYQRVLRQEMIDFRRELLAFSKTVDLGLRAQLPAAPRALLKFFLCVLVSQRGAEHARLGVGPGIQRFYVDDLNPSARHLNEPGVFKRLERSLDNLAH